MRSKASCRFDRVPSTGATGQGACDAGSAVRCSVGRSEGPAETLLRDRPPTQSVDFVCPLPMVEIRPRRISELTAEQKSLLQQLGIRLPERCDLNRKCSADLSIV